MAKCVRLIGENVATIANGSYITLDYGELISDKPIETRSAEEVKNSIKEKINKMK